ncbi:MAG: LTA synthase family protein, partial [Prevotella sp.]|nr:LTA synthase family protein [Prevotella sp.]
SVNPLFSFMESMNRQSDFDKQYRYMDEEYARKIVAPMLHHVPTMADSISEKVLSVSRPDIYLIIMESFSDTLTKQKDVTPNLNRLKREGVYFSRFYANSFRTDRGLVAILLGYPSPATVSLMKYPNKTASLPSLSSHLHHAGWGLKYYYGGDADFTNMRSFLVNQGFNAIMEDVDFPVSDRLSKWGVPDHLLFRRVEQDLKADRSTSPMFRVIQTSSSHEPFDVPYHRLQDKMLNAFAYTDSCVGGFVKYLKASGRWNRSLVILVPDHLGAWPEDADNFKSWRFHVPLIWTGGAIAAPRVVETFGSQQDIAATLLGQLGIDSRDMKFSKDLFQKSQKHFGFFMMNDGFGLVDNDNEVIFDHQQQKAVIDKGRHKGSNVTLGKAYVQTIFDDIAAR